MSYKYIPLIIAGAVVVAVSLPASFKLKNPWSALAALAMLAGVVMSLAGLLVFAVPHFFSR